MSRPFDFLPINLVRPHQSSKRIQVVSTLNLLFYFTAKLTVLSVTILLRNCNNRVKVAAYATLFSLCLLIRVVFVRVVGLG